MLKPAIMYKEEINKKFVNIWYDKNYMYYALDPGLRIFETDDNNYNGHSFASINENNEVVGIINYSIDWNTKSASSLGIMSFEKYNITFGKDLYQSVYDIFYKYNLNRLSWYAVADNPAVKSYDRFVSRYGGIRCGLEHENILLIDGKLHDSISYEILSRNFKRRYEELHNKSK